MFYLELKDCITQERENQGLTQEQLAQELKVESQCVVDMLPMPKGRGFLDD